MGKHPLGVTPFLNRPTRVGVDTKMLLDPRPVGALLHPALVYCAPFKLVDNRIPSPCAYAGPFSYYNMDTSDWGIPGMLGLEALGRTMERREFLMADSDSVARMKFNEETFKANTYATTSIYTSAQSSTWGDGGGPPAVLASGVIGAGFESNGYNVSRYHGGDPFTTVVPASSDYTVHQTMEFVPSLGLGALSQDVSVSGKYKQRISHIEDFVGSENVGGGFIWYAPVSPRYFYTDLMKGFDIGDATEIYEEEYVVKVSFSGKNSTGAVDPGLPVIIKSVETWGQIYHPYLSGSNTETTTDDQSARWARVSSSRSNHHEETVTFSGSELVLKVSGISAASRVVYPDYEGDVGWVAITNLVAGLSGLSLDKLIKVTASVSGFDSIGWVWLHLTPTLFAAKRTGGPTFFPSWMKIDGADWG